MPDTGFLPLRTSSGLHFLLDLCEESGTGPDGLSSKLLKACAHELCLPFTFLCRRIVRCGIWPRAWTTHWIHPLHKKGSKGDVLNFRGIHLTAQISKAAERFIGTLFVPRLQRFSAFGVNQFAYSKGRGARDAILFYICSWLSSFNRGMRVALYCSDVAAAFDRVDAGRLMEKLYCKGVHMDILRILRSWLQARSAYVVVNGVKSTSLTI